MAIERFKRERDRAEVNASESWIRETRKWLAGIGVELETHNFVDYGHTIEVKKSGRFIYVRSTYIYRAYPGTAGETNSTYLFLADGKIVADCRTGRDTWGEYECIEHGGFDYYVNEEENDGYGRGSGAREFKRIAHIILRNPEIGVVEGDPEPETVEVDHGDPAEELAMWAMAREDMTDADKAVIRRAVCRIRELEEGA